MLDVLLLLEGNSRSERWRDQLLCPSPPGGVAA